MIVVHAEYDDEVGRWTATSDDEHLGLVVEADSLEEVRNLVPRLILDLVEAGAPRLPIGTPIEIVAHMSARLPA